MNQSSHLLFRYCVAAVMMLVLATSTCPAAGTSLGSLRKIYTDELKKIKSDGSTVPVEEYVVRLKMLEKQKQAGGDLGGVVAVRAEAARFTGAGNELTDEHVVAAPADLAALQTQYIAKFREGRILPSRRIVSLARNYMARLTQLRVELTKDGKIDDALAANTEIDAIKASADYKGAQFAIAEYEASSTVLEDRIVEVPREDERRIENENKAAAPVVEPKTVNGCTVSVGKPAEVEDVSFKKVSTRATELARLKRDISVATYKGKESDSERVTRVASSARQESEKVYIRVALYASAGKKVEDAGVVIQCFSKAESSTAGSDPKQMRLFQLPVDEVTATATYIDCPPLSFSSTSHTTTWGGNNRWGQSFYGVIVSVFDGEGNVLHQSCSPSNLEDLAIKEYGATQKSPERDKEEEARQPFRRPTKRPRSR